MHCFLCHFFCHHNLPSYHVFTSFCFAGTCSASSYSLQYKAPYSHLSWHPVWCLHSLQRFIFPSSSCTPCISSSSHTASLGSSDISDSSAAPAKFQNRHCLQHVCMWHISHTLSFPGQGCSFSCSSSSCALHNAYVASTAAPTIMPRANTTTPISIFQVPPILPVTGTGLLRFLPSCG